MARNQRHHRDRLQAKETQSDTDMPTIKNLATQAHTQARNRSKLDKETGKSRHQIHGDKTHTATRKQPRNKHRHNESLRTTQTQTGIPMTYRNKQPQKSNNAGNPDQESEDSENAHRPPQHPTSRTGKHTQIHISETGREINRHHHGRDKFRSPTRRSCSSTSVVAPIERGEIEREPETERKRTSRGTEPTKKISNPAHSGHEISRRIQRMLERQRRPKDNTDLNQRRRHLHSILRRARQRRQPQAKNITKEPSQIADNQRTKIRYVQESGGAPRLIPAAQIQQIAAKARTRARGRAARRR